ncbi:MAG: epimerase [Planctomycetes bacterium]|jgi:NADH dehydrogenase|nr:epimerase [Planctomycetota bacterium]MDP6408616.1 NAD(P)H-binding protein [Planctomycetota bacterium]
MPRAIVTGAFSNIGSAVAAQFLLRGFDLHTLTNRRTPDGVDSITSAPLHFDPEHLACELDDADVMVSTYWVRLPHGGTTFDTAVQNLETLIGVAARAGVKRFVHVSVSNASLDSKLGYYHGKARVDEMVRASGMSYAIVRPTLVVGPYDVLTGNIVWFLRHFPIFPVPGGGAGRISPITLRDTGRVIVDAALASDDLDIDAAGPESYTFREYVELLARACGVRRLIFGAPAWLALAGIRLVELFVRDVILTEEELLGLQQDLLLTHKPPTGTESVETWLMDNAGLLGRSYVNDIHRHFGAGATTPIRSPTAHTTPHSCGNGHL